MNEQALRSLQGKEEEKTAGKHDAMKRCRGDINITYLSEVVDDLCGG